MAARCASGKTPGQQGGAAPPNLGRDGAHGWAMDATIPTMSARALVVALLCASCLFALQGCGSKAEVAQPKPAQCSSAASSSLEEVDPATLGVCFDAGTSPAIGLLHDEIQGYLQKAWEQPGLNIASGAPPAGKQNTVWFTTSIAARDQLKTSISSGYVLRRVDSGQRTQWIVYAPDATNLAYGAYAFLEQLGFRFFHPLEELVPELGGVFLPAKLDLTEKPAFNTRGMQPHTLHPIGFMMPFNVPGAQNLADAKHYIDWLVKTGQNYVQWPLLNEPSFADFAKHASAIVDYAHMRGVQVGASVELFKGSALQNNYVLVTGNAIWQSELESGLDKLMAVKWDKVEIALGEFFSADPSQVVAWLDDATQYMADHYPNVELSALVHVGNYPALWVTYQGKKTYFYHLAGYADPRLTSSVHTVYFFDLYRDWGTYKEPNFFFQRDYLFQQLPKRKVRYFPEAAYWIAGDIDVPQFLPEYIYSRWLDIHNLHSDIKTKGLPALDGHVLFSSGMEWNYWLTDYLEAHMLWHPDAPFTDSLKHYTSAFGPCGSELETDLEGLVDLQSKYLFDQKLVGYVSGENNTLDVGWLAGYESHPRRKSYAEVAKMDPATQKSFEHDVVDALDAMRKAINPLSKSVQAVCGTADDALRPWCSELADGFEIDRLRAAHAVLLYRAVLDWSRGGSHHAALLEQAAGVRAQAAKVVARREKGYRFDLHRMVDDYKNLTVYSFGYLRTAHTLCFWTRQEQQASTLIQTGYPASLGSLPTCQN